jgi:hypothetical protein
MSCCENEKLIFGNGRMMRECDLELSPYKHTCAIAEGDL